MGQMSTIEKCNINVGTNQDIKDLCNRTRATEKAINAKREYLEKRVIPRTLAFVKGHCLKNRESGESVPLSAVTRSNYLPEGRKNCLRVFWARHFRILDNIKGYQEKPKFLTLTIASSETSGLEQRRAVNRVMSRLRYQAKVHGVDGKLIYEKVSDVQVRGVIHYHFVLWGLPYLDKAYWDGLIWDTWRLGYIYKIKCVYAADGMAKYVSKYISKSIDTKSEDVPHDVLILRMYGVRRYSFSREGCFEPREKSGLWFLAEVVVKTPPLDNIKISQKVHLTIREIAQKIRKIAVSRVWRKYKGEMRNV